MTGQVVSVTHSVLRQVENFDSTRSVRQVSVTEAVAGLAPRRLSRWHFGRGTVFRIDDREISRRGYTPEKTATNLQAHLPPLDPEVSGC